MLAMSISSDVQKEQWQPDVFWQRHFLPTAYFSTSANQHERFLCFFSIHLYNILYAHFSTVLLAAVITAQNH